KGRRIFHSDYVFNYKVEGGMLAVMIREGSKKGLLVLDREGNELVSSSTYRDFQLTPWGVAYREETSGGELTLKIRSMGEIGLNQDFLAAGAAHGSESDYLVVF